MPNYRRRFVDGGTYFFTVNLRDRACDLLVRRVVDLKAAYVATRDRHPFETVALVVLPDHLHCVWRLPPHDDDFPTRWRLIKSRFTRRIGIGAGEGRRKGERGVWQRRFWEHLIRDDDDLAVHTDYVHRNPIKHGFVEDLDDWPYSTWHRRGVGW